MGPVGLQPASAMTEVQVPGSFPFASECVTEGHPDKLCDRLADAVLDACLAQDPDAQVDASACTKTGMVMVLGEIITKASVNYEQVIREAVKAIGYDSDDKGLDWRTMNVIAAIEEQSPDLAQAMSQTRAAEEIGVSDRGVAFGYATAETPELMPLSHQLATKLCAQFDTVRNSGKLGWLRPSARVMVNVDYKEASDGSVSPVRVNTVSILSQQAGDAKPEQIVNELMEQVVKPVVPEKWCDQNTVYHLTPAKQAVLGSASSDTGLAGRKVVADTYGGWVSHGGSSLSGKDGSKISRSATYGARWAARSLVEAGLCKRCQVQLAYFPGSTQPVSVSVSSFGSGRVSGKTDAELAEILKRNFDFRPGCLQRDLGLKAPHFQKLSAHGHFGRTDLQLVWEKKKELKA